MDTILQWVFALLVQVWRMRRHQDAWFRLHKQSDLIDAKRLERAVDTELARRLVFENGEPVRLDGLGEVRPTYEARQDKLFTEDDNAKK